MASKLTAASARRDNAREIIAEVGLDMNAFPTPGDLVSWARRSPLTIQSGPPSVS